MYTGLNGSICQQAWEITKGSVVTAARMGTTNKLAGAINVCYTQTITRRDFALVFAGTVTDDHPDASKYEQIALAKTYVSWETGLPSRKAQQDAPHLYTPGMTKWGGSVVENGLIVAFSGVEAVFDEAIAGTMLRWIVALCQHEMTREGGVMGNGESYML